jgi:adenylate kinase
VRIVLLGPPGAGKGTQSERIVAARGIPHVSTGDILRANVRDGTELGRTAKRYMDTGELVPDDVIISMVGARLDRPDASAGFLLDGFPRTVPQAVALERLVTERGTPIDVVLRLVVDRDELVGRLTGRRTCGECGRVVHVVHLPSAVEGVCDACGGTLVQRDDDREDVVVNRLEVYRSQTEPLERFYWERGLLRDVQATGDVEDVTRRALAALAAHDPGAPR